MKIKFQIIISLLLLTGILFPRNRVDDSVLVDLTNRKITVNEFRQRIEFTPWSTRNNPQEQLFKEDFLISLIAEKLSAMAFEDLKIDTSDIIKTTLRYIEKMLVKDALYRNEILNKVKITKKEQDHVFQKSLVTYYVKFIQSKDSVEIRTLFSFLQKGLLFDSLLVERDEYSLQKEIQEINYSNSQIDIAKNIYKNKNFTMPIFSNDWYYIFKIDSFVDYTKLKNFDLNKLYESVSKKLKETREQELYKIFYNKFFTHKLGRVDTANFNLFVPEFTKIIKTKFENYDSTASQKKIFIEYSDIIDLEAKLKSDFNKSLFYVNDTKYDIRDFMFRIMIDETYFIDTNKNYIANVIFRRIKNYISDEFLAEEGFRRKYNENKMVQDELQIWKDNFFANSLELYLKNKVKGIEEPEKDRLKISNNISKIYSYKVQEILVKNLTQVEEVLDKNNKGISFSKLVADYSIREWSKKNNGELGYITEGVYPEIGKVLAKLNLEEVYGPIQSDSGYSIIKLLDKIEIKLSANKNDTEDVKGIKENWYQKKYNEIRDSIIANYALSKIKSISYDQLKKIITSKINMIVYRYYGFGGKLISVPILQRYDTWYEKYLNLKEQNP